MSYRLVENWPTLVEDVRSMRIVSTIPSVNWNNGNKHGMQEGSISRDIVAFVSRRSNNTATVEEILNGLPTAFQNNNKSVSIDYVKEFLREIVKMGILVKSTD